MLAMREEPELIVRTEEEDAKIHEVTSAQACMPAHAEAKGRAS
ncbi:MAG: hypothetical protein ACT4TC_21915 [Myxococcaceae bacterium]